MRKISWLRNYSNTIQSKFGLPWVHLFPLYQCWYSDLWAENWSQETVTVVLWAPAQKRAQGPGTAAAFFSFMLHRYGTPSLVTAADCIKVTLLEKAKSATVMKQKLQALSKISFYFILNESYFKEWVPQWWIHSQIKHRMFSHCHAQSCAKKPEFCNFQGFQPLSYQ